jgi:hypothetical protein
VSSITDLKSLKIQREVDEEVSWNFQLTEKFLDFLLESRDCRTPYVVGHGFWGDHIEVDADFLLFGKNHLGSLEIIRKLFSWWDVYHFSFFFGGVLSDKKLSIGGTQIPIPAELQGHLGPLSFVCNVFRTEWSFDIYALQFSEGSDRPVSKRKIISGCKNLILPFEDVVQLHQRQVNQKDSSYDLDNVEIHQYLQEQLEDGTRVYGFEEVK